MKKQITFFVIMCIFCFLFYCCNNSADKSAASNDSASSDNNQYAGYVSQTEWGKHIATISGCGDCHTPKKMTAQGPADDSSLLYAGATSKVSAPVLNAAQLSKAVAATYDNTSWIGPWGNSYSANITPDSTGIGGWSEDQFITCIRQGLYKGIPGSRPIMPPMPVKSLSHMTDDELKALFAYLKTVNPISNVVAEYKPPTGTPE